MTPENFTYWLQGFVELQDTRPSEQQWKAIKDHLSLVFTKVTPHRPPSVDDMTKELEKILEKRKMPSPIPFAPYVNPNTPYCNPTIPAPWPTYPTVICSVSGTDKFTSTAK
jgi:hypothetical protein